MDYGTMLKKTIGNPSRKSAHHAVQAQFKGSSRELRGKVVRALAAQPLTLTALLKTTQAPRRKLKDSIRNLTHEGLIKKEGNIFAIT